MTNPDLGHEAGEDSIWADAKVRAMSRGSAQFLGWGCGKGGFGGDLKD